MTLLVLKAPQALMGVQGLRLITLVEPMNVLKAFPVLPASSRQFVLGKPVSRSIVPDTRTSEYAHRVNVSPDGTLVAIVRLRREILVFRADDLRMVRRIAVPNIGSVLWSPTGSHLVYKTLTRGLGIASVVGSFQRKLWNRSQAMVWSRDGTALYSTDSAPSPLTFPNARWSVFSLVSRRTGFVTPSLVVRSSWLSRISEHDRRTLDLDAFPDRMWRTYGLFKSNYSWADDTDGPVRDLLVTKKGVREIVRSLRGINISQTQAWFGKDIWFLRSVSLFGPKVAPRNAYWLGRLNLRSRRTQQSVLITGNSLNTMQMGIARVTTRG